MSAPQPQGPSPQLFFETVNAFQKSEALKAAIQLNMFTAIGEGNDTAQKIAKRCQIAERGARILCDYLVINQFLTKTDSRYALTQDTAVFLDRRSPAYIGEAIRFLVSPHTQERWQKLTESVRQGATAFDDGLTPDHPMWVDFARGMAPLMTMPAQALTKLLGIDKPQPLRVLSLAAGHGIYEITVAEQNPKAEVWAVDWPHVLEVAIENAKAAGVESRYHTIPGSAFDVNFGDGYDLVLVTNFLHHFDVPTNTTLMRKVQACLKPGGRAAILEFVPNEDRVSPPVAAGFSLVMLAGTPAGDAYTFSQYQSMLKDAGFRSCEVHPLVPTFFSVVLATK